jgi:hypothetical protein
MAVVFLALVIDFGQSTRSAAFTLRKALQQLAPTKQPRIQKILSSAKARIDYTSSYDSRHSIAQ